VNNTKISKILIFNPFGIGDVLFTTPLVRNLRENLKNIAISYLCNRRTYPLLKNNIFLERVLIFEKDEWRKLARESKVCFVKNLLLFFDKIRRERFDVVFDLSLNAQYGFFFRMAGIKTIIGFNFKGRGRFLTHKIDIPYGYRGKHVARYYLDLLKFLNIAPKDYKFDLFLSDVSLEKVRKILKMNDLNNDDFIVGVCPGSGDSWQRTAYFKRWPEDNFLKLCKLLQEERKAKIVLFGSDGEIPLCDYIFSNMEVKPLNLCGKISLEEFVSFVYFCNLIITNDGGPFHISQALGKKVVVFFGPVDSKVYGSYPGRDNCFIFKKDISCRPCYERFKFPGCVLDKKCLREIKVGDVFSFIEKII
jgi:lipopolysaccharide heptosyltransferase II